MSKIKLTKGALRLQRDNLERFRHYLPTLQLKKQQLQKKIVEARGVLDQKSTALKSKQQDIDKWSGLLADSRVDISEWVKPIEIITGISNVAGANLPVFESVKFQEAEYDLFLTPFWIDRGIEELRDLVILIVEMDIIKKQVSILTQELRITTQRVNLFEKVKIPECIENIRVIRIYLGDQQANAVGISKVAKKKIELVEAV
ncbi:MAG: V-type ATP synthase subunit D [Candidatus Zapsychrus exili]|nr:V-type ATP synthase subunit D [Candidatus Zapsychrus exili]